MEKISIRLPDGEMLDNADDINAIRVHITDGATVEIRRLDELVRVYRERIPVRSTERRP